MNDSTFYHLINDSLRTECKQLCDFTDTLDKTPAEKKSHIAEYKCAKYRYASLSLIHSIIHNNNHFRKLCNLKYSHYLLLPFDEILKKHADYLNLYESAPENEQPDFSLYYAILAFAEEEIEKLERKLPTATDWEKIELNERIGGLKYAITCLDNAWQRRKEVFQ